jgi:hypothetical protein
MKRKSNPQDEPAKLPETAIEEIRQRIKKQELQTTILKKIMDKTQVKK